MAILFFIKKCKNACTDVSVNVSLLGNLKLRPTKKQIQQMLVSFLGNAAVTLLTLKAEIIQGLMEHIPSFNF